MQDAPDKRAATTSRRIPTAVPVAQEWGFAWAPFGVIASRKIARVMEIVSDPAAHL
jgi:hypothetical protein